MQIPRLNDEQTPRPVDRNHRAVPALIALGLVSWLIYAGIALLSQRFTYGIPGVERPIIEVLGLLVAAFSLYFLALRTAVRARDRREVLIVIIVFSVGFRLLLLFSEPIQEVDIYRYLWDGQVSTHGVSPFRYSPEQVLRARSHNSQLESDSIGDGLRMLEIPSTVKHAEPIPKDLVRLVALRDESQAIGTILSRVHFGELTTVYPPVSQAVFALSALTTPDSADLATHVTVMKAWIVAFDLATIWLLILILRLVSKPVGWSLVYAWCPLVLKELSNSGHLDSIAVCLTTLAIYLALRAFQNGRHDAHATCVCSKTNFAYSPPRDADGDLNKQSVAAEFSWCLASAVVLALAVGAKLYPLVLSPLLIVVCVRRIGWKRATPVCAVFVVVSLVLCWPMFSIPDSASVSRQADISELAPPMPPGVEAAPQAGETLQPTTGLKAFLSRWKMNDFLFLVLIENLSLASDVRTTDRPWFVIVPEHWRVELINHIARQSFIAQAQVPFFVSRMVTMLVFLVLLGWLCWQAVCMNDMSRFLEAVFLTLAWFWLLSPTQNPWYWIWVLPFVPFSRNRAWLAMSGLLLIYYLRFWFIYHWPDSPVAFTRYHGKLFFDYVVIWLEFGPWFVWLAISAWHRHSRASAG